MGETVHRTTNVLTALLLDDVHKSCAREWSRVLPLVHWVMMMTPILESGLTPRDLDRAWSMRDDVERELVGFQVGLRLPAADWAKQVFERFRMVQSSFAK